MYQRVLEEGGAFILSDDHVFAVGASFTAVFKTHGATVAGLKFNEL